ncbi:hypothetical protein, partial [Aureimonas sp. Leaf454]|uniref:hypothetical protein n=1 Tax=Aureimonas sp. Leaf454 TaxID=1736381 RepID=UPI000A3EBB67
MHVIMTSLRRAKNNDWFARKGIPADLRDSYAATFGVRQEERFRRPAALSPAQAKAAFADWLAEVEGRIARLQSLHDGTQQTLTARERRGLCGQWYTWFTRQHEDDP